MKSKLNWFLYPLLGLVFGIFVYFFTPNDGKRLPFYYTPDGKVLPTINAQGFSFHKVLRIGSLSPIEAPVVFSDSEKQDVIIKTEEGELPISLIANDRWKILFDFKMVLAFALINLLAALWLFSVARDLLLGFLCLVQTIFALSSYAVLVSEHLFFTWLFSGILMPPALLNMGLRTTGKDVPAYTLLAELILALFLALIAIVGARSISTLQNLGFVNFGLFFLALLATLGMQVFNLFQKTDDLVARYKRKFMLGGTLFGICLPSGLFFLSWFWGLERLSLDWIVFPGLFFPVTLIYSTYRLHFVRFQLVLTRSLVAGILTVVLIGIYGGVLLLHSMLLPEKEGEYSWIVNTVFVLILAFLLDPVRRKVSYMIETRLYRLDTRLMESLKILTSLVARHSRIQPTVHNFLREIENTLEVEKVCFLFASKSFPDLKLKHGDMLRISDESPVWRYFHPGDLRVSSYLAYAAGGRGELFRYLYKNNYLLGIGVVNEVRRKLISYPSLFQSQKKAKNNNEGIESPDEPIRVALLLGYKKDRSKLRLNEIRYLQEAAKLAGLLIYNYALLIRELAKRRRIRELQLAGIVQRSLPGPTRDVLEHFDIAYINKPAVSVSGDYLDILSLSPTRFALIIGDVSGHGLGTGYIASASRSIIRSHLFAGWPLADTINSLNTFLVERYRGGEFITLFAGIINVESGRLEYINAAHPGPLIRRINGEFQELISTQRLVGVLPTVYSSEGIYLHPKERIFLFSDGVTETFNSQDVAYGDRRLLDFLQQNGDQPVTEIVKNVEQELLEFREDIVLTDDTTFVAIEFRPQLGVLRNLLSILGIGKKEP